MLLHSDLELPYPLPKFFSTYLLMAIAYTGGEKLAHAGLTSEVAATIVAAMCMAILEPFATFFFLRKILSIYDAAAMTATYGSIRIVTFVVGSEFLNRQHVAFGGHMVAMMSLMESPAVIAGIMLVRMFAPRGERGGERPGLEAILHESFFNGTVLLLIGSLIIGVTPPDSLSAGGAV